MSFFPFSRMINISCATEKIPLMGWFCSLWQQIFWFTNICTSTWRQFQTKLLDLSMSVNLKYLSIVYVPSPYLEFIRQTLWLWLQQVVKRFNVVSARTVASKLTKLFVTHFHNTCFGKQFRWFRWKKNQRIVIRLWL